MRLLKKILDTLPLSQRRAISATAAELERTGVLPRSRTLSKRRDLKAQVEENLSGPTFRAVKAVVGSRVSSDAWNGMQERLFSDLSVLYDQITILGGKLSTQSKIAFTSFIATRLVILKLIEQVRVYQFLKENPEYQDVRFLNFLDGRNESDRGQRAVIDQFTRKVELAPRQRVEQQSANVDTRTTDVTTKHHGGGISGGFSKEFVSSNMLDGNPETFWGELVLKDSPSRFEYLTSWGSLQAEGVVGEVELNLHRAERVNNIRMLPFGNFPIRVVDVAYKESVTDDAWTTIPEFVLQDATLDYIELDFPVVHMAVLRVSLEQPNYTRHIYHLPERLVQNVSLWEQVLDQNYDQILHQVDLDAADLSFVEAQPEALAWLNALDVASEDIASRHLDLRRATLLDTENQQLQSLGRALAGTEPTARTDLSEPVGTGPVEDPADLVEVAKFEYVYGLRTITLNNILYATNGHFATPKMNAGATVLDIELDVEEEHVTFNDEFGSYHRTSIEYEVETGQNRRFPIHPGDDPKVLDETIFIDRRTRQGVTRFPVDSVSVLVRKNGIRLDAGQYSLVINSSLEDKGVLTVVENAFDANATYTITYYSTESARKLSLRGANSTALLEPETFAATDRDNRVQLNYYPFVEYSIINATDWERDDAVEARWRFVPSIPNKTSTDGTQADVISGSDIVYLSTGMDALTDQDPLYLRLGNETAVRTVSVLDVTGLQMTTGYDGPTTGVDYQLGIGVTLDGTLYTLDTNTYEPIEIFVNDQKAQNLTRYEDFENPAFVPGESGRRLQYVQAGRNVYFSAPVTASTIEVDYRWMTQYLRVNAILRSNFPIRTEVTPKIAGATLKLKTTRL